MNDDDADDRDEHLMLAYAAGDVSAFARLYERHERPVYRYFRRQGVAAHTADDLLQETWMAVLGTAGRWTFEASFRTLLYLIAHRKLIDHWRATNRHVLLDDAANDPDDESDSALERVEAGDAARPDVRAMSRQQAEAFVAAVQALPPPQREAFLLHVDGELTMDQMAAVTGVGMETQKSRLRYAMKRVRRACADWLEPRAVQPTSGERDAL